ncbi:MAG TPA: hypothetical protein DCQ26_10635 [Marinilabiliales bacterium]|nr:MAG: hypothetical protein A2W95_13780 [Bacteroidetes bacterium GWA2_40_14]OFX58265.1 MAG: hypothetical protein A2W84_16370 [Bacteroidetes bacterium GWC2_40_13]OFX72571.1 MAG: hypothetical protein A2W96_04990 [Bacteroidetes bacterium GWD2_40_43]OFX94141.1 MAG: hypothetical protein A2W97_17620 [Bacteroidetes bacterium GWE2_40_63]OFY20293.1 MAG: hypothetical protein A2W88_12590 [Bacteroidetes bacterium GWF2_40_13]OFZ31829.1 MAG: hypothetical protein A2437_07805 [Bacteroidetes bacterium RIFOXYC
MPTNKDSALKTTIITALISMVGTVLVSLIGILPQIRKKDALLIEENNKRIEELSQQIAQMNPGKEPEGTITIVGTTFRNNLKNQPQSNIEIYLLPASGSELVTTTDDAGKFTFSNVPNQDWWIIARNPLNEEKSSGRSLIDTKENFGYLDISGAYIQYNINH